ncbi:MAG: hypothetical protein JXP34_28260 [Planctomycetes bacterium]|nr:hypothetical protein [Planctomycetota bacterium]
MRKLALGLTALAGLALAVLVASGTGSGAGAEKPAPYRSPASIALGGDVIYIADATAGVIEILGAGDGALAGEIALASGSEGIAMAADGKRLYAVETEAGTLAEIDPAARRVVRRVPVGHGPWAVALAEKKGKILVANRYDDAIAVVDAAGFTVSGRVPVVREPGAIAVSADEGVALVANIVASGSIEEARSSASIIRLDDLSVRHVRLPVGSTNARGAIIAPNGRFGYIAHALGRYHIPPTQIERGWINNSCLSIIDLQAGEAYATFLLDHVHEGAGDPWAMAMSPDGSTLWISLAGTDRIAEIPIARVHKLLDGDLPPELAREPQPYEGSYSSWLAVKKDPKARVQLVDDLAALAVADAIRKFPAGGKSPRAIAFRDGTLYAAHYYSATASALDPAKGRAKWTGSVGDAPAPDAARRGEIAFHDANLCFQKWQSCATCHPDGRSEGLRWDLLNDGMGNPKRTRSMVYSPATHPVMAMGVRDSTEIAIRAGFTHILFAVVPEETIDDIYAYFRALEPVPSPHLAADGGLTEAARKGKEIFDGKAECARCHTGSVFTDMKLYDVGTLGEFDKEGDRFTTPKLVEVWRGAPYLHDGRAETVEEVLRKYNPNDQHGKTSSLSDEEFRALAEYLKSI